VSGYFDLGRINELQELMGTDANALVASALARMTASVEELETKLAAGRLDQAVQPAHACRNDALMLGARPLLDALTALEAAAREADEPRAHDALERVEAVWPATRDGLAGIARTA
jgi:HPt (histidine-containing phosphotransfer) domain-containing protein